MTAQGLYIDGAWSHTEQTRTIRDRWAETDVARVAVADAHHSRDAVDAAQRALEYGLPVSRRVEILDGVARWIESHLDEAAELVRIEVDKPISAARGEAVRAAQTFRFAANAAMRLPGESLNLDAVPAGEGVIGFTIPEPRGIVAAITPFNFPLNLSAHKIGPAIAAGCPVVFKPAARCPLSAGFLVRAFEAAGLPAGFLNLVTGPASEIVDVWQGDPRVAVINFTGSPAVGWALKAASPRKLHILELGSNSAMVVHEDADLDRAARDAVLAGFANSGQICISLQRLFVHERVADEFVARVTELTGRVRYGDPRDPDTVVAPLITEADAVRLESWFDDAVQRGSRIAVGGGRDRGLVHPTVLIDVPSEAIVMQQEAFGPVVAVARYRDLAEAVSKVNDSDFGLNTSFYSSSIAAALQFARGVRTGQVLINLPPSFRTDNMPYGGVKDSGQGVEGVQYAVAELTHQKPVIVKE